MTCNRPIKLVAFSDIAGWAEDDHAQAHLAFCLSSNEIIKLGNGLNRCNLFGGDREDWLEVCHDALITEQAKNFFESEFQPVSVLDDSAHLFTGYYEPQVLGSLKPTNEFTVPIYAKPDDLVAFTEVERRISNLNYGRRDCRPQPYFSRREIEQGALHSRGLEICYLHSWVDAYFLHIQGNGRVLLPDGKSLRLSFAAKNGLAYNSIGGVLLKRGIGTHQTMSMQFLKNWMRDNPNAAKELMWENSSFIFFSASNKIDPKLGAIGAGKVPLTPQRSMAVDRSFWAFGTPLFLSTKLPPETGGADFRHLMIAQDTGSAIKGMIRGDIYFGWGLEAERAAGHMKNPGEMIALLPKKLAKRLAQ